MSVTVALYGELRAALAAPTPEQDQELIALGVPADITYYVGAAKVRPNGNTYEPDPDGVPAWIIPVMDGGEIADALAFTPDEPGRWWLRTGVCAFLGGDALGDTVMDEPVCIFKTPLAWLRAGAPPDGLVILDDNIARRDLAHHSIVAEDLAHGLELDRLLTIPAQRPQVRVPREAAA